MAGTDHFGRSFDSISWTVIGGSIFQGLGLHPPCQLDYSNYNRPKM